MITLDSPLLAGMPTITLSDFAVPRLQVISFFLMGLLVSAGVVMLVWNGLRRDFGWLPRLSFGKACGVVVLWGLLFVIVLTMISGARELMTPGAWEKDGRTYKLAATKPAATERADDSQRIERQAHIEQLKLHLIRYAQEHEGRFPESLDELGTGTRVCELPGFPGTKYLLVAQPPADDLPHLLAYEPEVYDGDHFAIFAGGATREMPFDEIRRLAERQP